MIRYTAKRICFTSRRSKGSYISHVEQNSRDLPGGPFPERSWRAPYSIHITMRDDGGSVQGAVRKKEGVVDPGLVVLAPVDRSREHLFRTAKAGKDGSFQLSDIAPGDYDIYAFSRNDEDHSMRRICTSGSSQVKRPASRSRQKTPGAWISISSTSHREELHAGA